MTLFLSYIKSESFQSLPIDISSGLLGLSACTGSGTCTSFISNCPVLSFSLGPLLFAAAYSKVIFDLAFSGVIFTVDLTAI